MLELSWELQQLSLSFSIPITPGFFPLPRHSFVVTPSTIVLLTSRHRALFSPSPSFSFLNSPHFHPAFVYFLPRSRNAAAVHTDQLGLLTSNFLLLQRSRSYLLACRLLHLRHPPFPLPIPVCQMEPT